VVAFEPGYAAHKELCDNLLLNGCEASVVPIPLGLAARDGLAEIKYVQGQPGEPGYTLRDDREWRVTHRGRNKPYLQPACLVRLDTVVERHRLPSPHHLRLSPQIALDAVLAGATSTLRLPSLKTICLHVTPEREATVVNDLARVGWVPTTRTSRSTDVQLVFTRVTA
jgi:FkbM family methyltransferase